MYFTVLYCTALYFIVVYILYYTSRKETLEFPALYLTTEERAHELLEQEEGRKLAEPHRN